MASVRGLSELDLTSADSVRPLTVCVVSSEILGPIKNGGIGAATTGLIQQLAGDGHQVTVLYTLVEFGVPVCVEKTWDHWVKQLGRNGIGLVHIRHDDDYRSWRKKAWLVKEFLGDGEFDVVYFNEHHASAYYALAAKRVGIAPFTDQLHCVITHGAIEWVFNTNDQSICRASDLEMIGMERRSVEWADVVIGPSRYLLREYERYGWKLPRNTFCQPYALALAGAASADPELRPVVEIVFSGRLETRKGLWLFCDALDRVAARLSGKMVTFMGRITDVSGVPSAAFILNRSAKWPFRVRLLTEYGQEEALAYLKQPGRVAVMPSLADNSPCVVYECMENRIPFIATSGSGTAELLHPDCWQQVMVEPTVDALSEGLTRILDHGAGLGWPCFNPDENLRIWSSWHWWLSANRSKLSAPPPADPSRRNLREPTAAPQTLLVTLDAESCSLRLLLDTLSVHMERFGGNVGHIVLSPRRGPLVDLMTEIVTTLAAAFGTSASILKPDEAQVAKDSILSTDIAFFVDADHELLPAFWVTAMNLLTQQRAAAVSCVVAERQDRSSQPAIVELPCGDMPAAGGLGLPLGSGVWAARTDEMHDALAALELHRRDCGELATAASLGQAILHQCVVAGKRLQLLPRVGAIRTREAITPQRRRHWYHNARQAARTLGIAPYVHPHAAPWFAMLTARAGAPAEPDRIAAAATLPEEHPLRQAPKTGSGIAEAAELAAALGRPDLAVQLSLTEDAGGQRVNALLAAAEQAMRRRPVLDLTRMLRSGEVRQFPSRRAVPEAGTAGAGLRQRLASLQRARMGATTAGEGSARPAAAAPGEPAVSLAPGAEADRPALPGGNPLRVYLDQLQLHLLPDALELEPENEEGGLARLLLTDVPLAGHRQAEAGFVLARRMRALVRMILLDQTTGAEIGRAEAQIDGSESAALAVPVYGIYQLASILVEFLLPAEDKGRRSPTVVRLARLEVV